MLSNGVSLIAFSSPMRPGFQGNGMAARVAVAPSWPMIRFPLRIKEERLSPGCRARMPLLLP